MAKNPIRKLETYNPLAKRELGASVAKSLLEQPISVLPPKEIFEGAGIYAIYYMGAFASYDFIREANEHGKCSLPIYVGKAVPKGARKGGFGLDIAPGTVLCSRMREHAETLRGAKFNLKDFACRYLAVDDIWIPLGENLLIEMFQPLWNSVLDGFGNHDPGSGRYKGMRPPWHVVHPGISWAAKCRQHSRSAAEFLRDVEAFKRGQLKPKLTPEEIVIKEASESEDENGS
ncbi:MAG TPA: Eco29kI family restriction endonuclease [Verrucomicrobiae bacterium]|nr:Eco29kI family restriction endonuclease [Verrucomicrobiae bacterium]